MVNMEKLKNAIKTSGKSVSEIAEKIGIDVSTLYRKLQNGGEKITVKEASQISDILSLDGEKANEIFFGNKVADMRKNKA